MRIGSIALLFALIGCGPKTHTETPGVVCGPYFEYDQIEHHWIEEMTSHYFTAREKSNKTPLEQRYFDIVWSHKATLPEDSTMFTNLAELGFQQASVALEKFQPINDFFCGRTPNESMVSPVKMCIPSYRDILVFRRYGKMVGVARICFECDQYAVSGQNNTFIYYNRIGLNYEDLFNTLGKVRLY
jgi:hypothetical protein